jgi:hypothetical protein
VIGVGGNPEGAEGLFPNMLLIIFKFSLFLYDKLDYYIGGALISGPTSPAPLIFLINSSLNKSVGYL